MKAAAMVTGIEICRFCVYQACIIVSLWDSYFTFWPYFHRIKETA